jgi:hypothetical protein
MWRVIRCHDPCHDYYRADDGLVRELFLRANDHHCRWHGDHAALSIAQSPDRTAAFGAALADGA